MNRNLSWNEALELANDTRARGGVVVTSNGCFDILHKGHVQYLEWARSLGDLLIVAINTDKSVQKIKGPSRPINAENDRAYVLSALSCVDGVCIFEEETPTLWLQKIRPNIHVKGADWQGKQIPEETVLKEWNGKIQYATYTQGYSTSAIIDKSKGN